MKIIFGQLLWTFDDFLLVTLVVDHLQEWPYGVSNKGKRKPSDRFAMILYERFKARNQ